MARVTALSVEIMGRPFAWGTCDCCTAACDVFRALHGIDPMAPLRDRYADRREAMDLIRRAGGWPALLADLAQRAGLQPGSGQPGEIGATRRSLVICAAPGVWLGKSLRGVTTVSEVEVSWCA